MNDVKPGDKVRVVKLGEICTVIGRFIAKEHFELVNNTEENRNARRGQQMV